MRFHRNRSHVIDRIFPLAVLFVFAASSLVVLILSVHIYTGQTEQAEAHYRTDTPLSYIEEKIRQNDVAGSIAVKTLDGTECLALKKIHPTASILPLTSMYPMDGSKSSSYVMIPMYPYMRARILSKLRISKSLSLITAYIALLLPTLTALQTAVSCQKGVTHESNIQ